MTYSITIDGASEPVVLDEATHASLIEIIQLLMDIQEPNDGNSINLDAFMAALDTWPDAIAAYFKPPSAEKKPAPYSVEKFDTLLFLFLHLDITKMPDKKELGPLKDKLFNAKYLATFFVAELIKRELHRLQSILQKERNNTSFNFKDLLDFLDYTPDEINLLSKKRVYFFNSSFTDDSLLYRLEQTLDQMNFSATSYKTELSEVLNMLHHFFFPEKQAKSNTPFFIADENIFTNFLIEKINAHPCSPTEESPRETTPKKRKPQQLQENELLRTLTQAVKAGNLLLIQEKQLWIKEGSDSDVDLTLCNELLSQISGASAYIDINISGIDFYDNKIYNLIRHLYNDLLHRNHFVPVELNDRTHPVVYEYPIPEDVHERLFVDNNGNESYATGLYRKVRADEGIQQSPNKMVISGPVTPLRALESRGAVKQIGPSGESPLFQKTQTHLDKYNGLEKLRAAHEENRVTLYFLDQLITEYPRFLEGYFSKLQGFYDTMRANFIATHTLYDWLYNERHQAMQCTDNTKVEENKVIICLFDALEHGYLFYDKTEKKLRIDTDCLLQKQKITVNEFLELSSVEKHVACIQNIVNPYLSSPPSSSVCTSAIIRKILGDQETKLSRRFEVTL